MEKPSGYEAFVGILSDSEEDQRALWTSEELYHAAEVVRELKRQPGWAVVQELLKAHERMLVDQMVLSQPSDHAREARRAGIVAGVRTAMNAADSVLYAAERREEVDKAAAEAAEGAQA